MRLVFLILLVISGCAPVPHAETPLPAPQQTVAITPTVIPTQPATPDKSAPVFGQVGWNFDLFYSPKVPIPCNGHTYESVQARIKDETGLRTIHLQYRFTRKDGYVGEWHSVKAQAYIEPSTYIFEIDFNKTALLELGTNDGEFEFQIHAEDEAGNIAVYPAEGVVSEPIQYCAP